MTAPSKSVRGRTYLRDGFQCVACGNSDKWVRSWQHREASGQGGRGKKAPKLTPADGVTMCLPCNQSMEADGQDRGLALGWKIRRNRGQIQACEIPFYDVNTRLYYLPDVDGNRKQIPHALAQELLEAAGAFDRKKDAKRRREGLVA